MVKSPKELIPYFFDKNAKTYDRMVCLATFGKDMYWKKEIVNKINSANSVLDLACGTGILTRMIFNKFPYSRIVGVDISKRYLDVAIKKSSSCIVFFLQDAEKIKFEEKFDCVCSSYIPKYCNPTILIKRCINHLSPNGTIILHDFVFPENFMVQTLWKLHFVLLRFLGIFLPSWRFAFAELPKLIQDNRWVEQYTHELEVGS